MILNFKIIIFGILINQISSIKISCRDEDGKPIEWYYLYKLPSTYINSNGLKYLYLTPSTTQGWQLSNYFINDSNSFPGRTLSTVFNSTETMSLAYNDETPNGSVNEYDGHAKGVLSADFNSGFWLIHSVPKYPFTNSYSYPKSGVHYGQSFLCITFNNATQINQIGEQLIYNEVNIYYSNIPEDLTNIYTNFVNLTKKEWKKNGPFHNHISLNSIDGLKFESFAKSRKFNKELYEDWIAPTLNSNLLVETWRNGAGNFPSNCTKSKYVLNVSTVKIDKIEFSFKSTKDHSKWAVTESNDNNENWICVGDINRQQHQLQRGGGTVCLMNMNIAKTYRNLVYNVEPCHSTIENF